MNSAEANIIIKPDTTGCNHYTESEWFLSLSAMIWWINTHIVIWALQLWEWNNEWHRAKKPEQQSLNTALKSTSLPLGFSFDFSNEMWFQRALWELGSCHAGYPCSAEGCIAPRLQHLPQEAQHRAAPGSLPVTRTWPLLDPNLLDIMSSCRACGEPG